MIEQIKPELVERMATWLRDYVGCEPGHRYGLNSERSQAAEARAIVAELPAPVDPDILLARDVAEAVKPGNELLGEPSAMRAGVFDHSPLVQVAFAAIKRVRSEQGAKA